MDAIETVTSKDLDHAEAAVRVSLADQGFGVLTEIDVAATLQNKLGIERPPLRILGACNPSLAHEALQLDPAAALVIPCNVSLEPAEGGPSCPAMTSPSSQRTPPNRSAPRSTPSTAEFPHSTCRGAQRAGRYRGRSDRTVARLRRVGSDRRWDSCDVDGSWGSAWSPP